MAYRLGFLVLLATIVAGPLEAQVTARVLLLDGEVVEGPVRGMNPEGQAIVVGAGKGRPLSIDRVISLVFPNRLLGPGASNVRLELLSGEILVGVLERSDLLDTLRISLPGAGTLRISIDEVRRLVLPVNLPRGVTLPSLREKGDVLHLAAGRRLDSIPGEVVRVAASQVIWATEGGEERRFDYARNRVVAIDLEPLDAPKPLDGLSAHLNFTGGSLLHGRLVPLGNGGLGLLRGEAKIALDPAHLLRIDLKGGSFAFLSELAPAEILRTPYIEGGSARPLQVDRGFDGARRLRIGEVWFERGLGIVAKTRLRWEVPQRFRKLRALLGVDAGTAKRRVSGSARVVIHAGGKPIFDSGPLRAGEPPVPLDLDLGDATNLEVEVLRANPLSVGSRVVLANALLLETE